MLYEFTNTQIAALRELVALLPQLRKATGATTTPRLRPMVGGPGALTAQGTGGTAISLAAQQLESLSAVVPGLVVAKVTGNAAGNGYYEVELYRIAGGVLDPSTALTATKVGLAGAKFAVGYGVSLQEIDASTHDLTNASNTLQLYFAAFIIGPASTNGRLMVLMLGNPIWLDNCP